MGKGLAGLWMIVLAVTVSACGAPQFTYAANQQTQTYFKVPSGWHQLSDSQIALIVPGGPGEVVLWRAGYDASAVPSIRNALGGRSAQPFTLVVVARLSPSMASAVSYNVLRDMILPVTPQARALSPEPGLTGFHLVSDTMLQLGQGIHGVREIFGYTLPGGNIQIYDKIALTNADDTQLYVLMTHCRITCYLQHQREIEAVMTSFTVRSQG